MNHVRVKSVCGSSVVQLGLSGVELGALPADLSLLLALRWRAVSGLGVADFWYAFAMVKQ